MKELADCRVLIVDDVKANVDILVHALGGDYKLSVALDGQQAIDAVQRSLPDLVLLDIMMPDIDGYEICRRLRAEESTRELPIMFLSSLEDVNDKARGFEVGGVGAFLNFLAFARRSHVRLRFLQVERGGFHLALDVG